jgi:hypothetical protein
VTDYPLAKPDGMTVTYARGVMIEARAGTVPTMSLWTATAGTATPVTWRDEGSVACAYVGAQHPRSRSARALSLEWLRELVERPSLACELSGVFALFVIDKPNRRVLLVGDRLGVQAVHHGVDGRGTWRASTHLFWLLLANQHDGRVDDRGFFAHMAFGYGVDPHRDVYRGIGSLPPAGYLSFDGRRVAQGVYWRAPEPSDTRGLADVGSLVGALQHGLRAQTEAEQPFLGLTAGKDSLCLAAVTPPSVTPRTGTLGAVGCADRVQATRVARTLDWPHVSSGVCGEDEFWAWADYIATHSAGLATVSYADMAAFVAREVPAGSAFVMGEGGECVRDFFRSDDASALDRLVKDYMTPPELLRGTLAGDQLHALEGYPERLIAALRATIDARDDDHFVSHFYRFQRMAGNFSLRNAVLSSIRPKLSPFLDSAFIDATYGLALAEYRGSALHRRIITHARPALAPYFDRPIKSRVSTQEWPMRLPGLLRELSRRLRDMSAYADDVVDPSGVQALCEATERGVGRSVYHLFRLYSFVAARALLRNRATEHLRSIDAEVSTPAAVSSDAVLNEASPTGHVAVEAQQVS